MMPHGMRTGWRVDSRYDVGIHYLITTKLYFVTVTDQCIGVGH